MNTRHTIRHALLGSAMTVLALAAGAAAAATPASQTVAVMSVTVNYGDLDLSRPAGAKTLYSRLRVAAREVCGTDGLRGIEALSSARDCRQQALDQAIKDVAQPVLTAMHLQHAGSLG